MKLSDLEIFTCMDGYRSSMRGLGITVNTEAGNKHLDNLKRALYTAQSVVLVDGNLQAKYSSLISEADREMNRVEGFLNATPMKIEDFNAAAEAADMKYTAKLLEAVKEAGVVMCEPSWLLKPTGHGCAVNTSMVPFVLAGGFTLLALVFMLRK